MSAEKIVDQWFFQNFITWPTQDMKVEVRYDQLEDLKALLSEGVLNLKDKDLRRLVSRMDDLKYEMSNVEDLMEEIEKKAQS